MPRREDQLKKNQKTNSNNHKTYKQIIILIAIYILFNKYTKSIKKKKKFIYSSPVFSFIFLRKKTINGNNKARDVDLG
jgi:hypothetical protein